MAFSFSGIVVVTAQSRLPERRPSRVSFHSAMGQSSRACTAEAGDLEEADISGLLSMLASVPDPRDRRARSIRWNLSWRSASWRRWPGRRITGRSGVTRPTCRRNFWKLGAKWSWFKLRQAAFVRREVFEISGDRISKENALIITGGKPGEMTAADVNLHVRKHWGIENKSHYIRDTVYRGDHGQAWPAKDRKSPRLSATSWRS
jgi:hypothetical protein